MQSIKKPKLFWVSAGAPLLCVIISTLLVFAIKGQNHGISVVSINWIPTYYFILKIITLTLEFFLWTSYWCCLLDWQIATRDKSSFMEYVALSWKSLRPSYENRAYHWHFVSHCKLNVFFSKLGVIINSILSGNMVCEIHLLFMFNRKVLQ